MAYEPDTCAVCLVVEYDMQIIPHLGKVCSSCARKCDWCLEPMFEEEGDAHKAYREENDRA